MGDDITILYCQVRGLPHAADDCWISLLQWPHIVIRGIADAGNHKVPKGISQVNVQSTACAHMCSIGVAFGWWRARTYRGDNCYLCAWVTRSGLLLGWKSASILFLCCVRRHSWRLNGFFLTYSFFAGRIISKVLAYVDMWLPDII